VRGARLRAKCSYLHCRFEVDTEPHGELIARRKLLECVQKRYGESSRLGPPRRRLRV
jgi:hypothetical protein